MARGWLSDRRWDDEQAGPLIPSPHLITVASTARLSTEQQKFRATRAGRVLDAALPKEVWRH